MSKGLSPTQRTQANAAVLEAVSEKDFRQQVLDLARLCGWRCYFSWSSIHSPAGFPDLVMVRLSRLIFAELKSERGRLSPQQREWLSDLDLSGKAEVFEWRPSNWPVIEEVLR